MTYIDAEIKKELECCIGDKEIVYTKEVYSKNGKYFATFKGILTIKKRE